MIDYKKAYYYVICLMAFFVLLWGTIDFGSASTSYFLTKQASDFSEEKQDRPLDEYYQKKMVQERLGDSLVRILVAGGIFIFCRKKVNGLEGGK